MTFSQLKPKRKKSSSWPPLPRFFYTRTEPLVQRVFFCLCGILLRICMPTF